MALDTEKHHCNESICPKLKNQQSKDKCLYSHLHKDASENRNRAVGDLSTHKVYYIFYREKTINGGRHQKVNCLNLLIKLLSVNWLHDSFRAFNRHIILNFIKHNDTKYSQVHSDILYFT